MDLAPRRPSNAFGVSRVNLAPSKECRMDDAAYLLPVVGCFVVFVKHRVRLVVHNKRAFRIKNNKVGVFARGNRAF